MDPTQDNSQSDTPNAAPGAGLPQPQDVTSTGMALPDAPLSAASDMGADLAGVSPPSAAPAWLPPTIPVQSAAPVDNTPVAAALPPVPDVAEDTNLIEKEWVIRAKQIVNGTRQDPYEQTKQIGKFKAEYMKKRYNKTIGSTDD